MASQATRPTGRPAPAPTQTQHQSAASPSIEHERIAKLAYEKWCKRGCPHGHDRQDWTEAESELRAEMSKPGAPAPRR